MPLTVEDIERIAAELKDLPPIENKQRAVSKQEAVKLLAKEIAGLQQRGYTLEQIASLLHERGLDINTRTLKSYLQRAKSAKRIDTPRRARRPVAPPPDTGDPAPGSVLLADSASPT